MTNIDFPPLNGGRANGAQNGNGNGVNAQIKVVPDSSIVNLAISAKDTLMINDKAAALAVDSNKQSMMKKPLDSKEAKETLAETKDMIQSDLASAMLAQANASPQSFLSLFS